MRRPASRAYVVAVALIGAFALAIVAATLLEHRLGVIEHQVTTIEHRKTVVVAATPCLRSDDRACQAFIGALLADATRAELKALLGVESIRIPARGLPRLVSRLHLLLHPRHHHRKPVIRPPSPFSPIPPTPRPQPPEGVMPPGPKPKPGNGLPGRPRQRPRSPSPLVRGAA